MARQIDVPFDDSALHRIAHGLAQVGSTPPDRRAKVDNAFGTRHGEHSAILGRREGAIILFCSEDRTEIDRRLTDP